MSTKSDDPLTVARDTIDMVEMARQILTRLGGIDLETEVLMRNITRQTSERLRDELMKESRIKGRVGR